MPCLDRNGEITDYAVTARSSDGMEVTAVADVANRRATISNLSPSTQYTVSVAAVNSVDSGPTTDIIVNTTGLWCAQSLRNIIHFSRGTQYIRHLLDHYLHQHLLDSG